MDKKIYGFEGYMDPTLIDDEAEEGDHKSIWILYIEILLENG